MSHSLKSKTLHGLFWAFFEQIGEQGIQFIISIILARLLMPEQFGLIVLVGIFIAIAETFINSGFGKALIQKKDATHIDECSIFYFNIFVGFLAAGLLCLAAPWIADFYKQPLLTPLTRVLSINLIINAFGLVQITLLTRHIDFKTQLKVNIIATVLSGTIGVTMALNGFGVWSLAALYLGHNLFRTTLLWFFNTWRPSLVFSVRALREMFGFGSRLLASGLLETIFQNIYLMVIGRLFYPAALGFYSRANRLQQLPIATFSSIVNRVTFPVFSTIQDDANRLKRGMQKALTTMALINFPMMIGLAGVAKPLVLVLLTEKWAPSIPYLQLLCVVGLLYPLHVINLNILLAKGRSDLYFRLEVLKKIIIVVSIAVTYRWGILGMIYGQIVVAIVSYYLNSYYAGKLFNYPLKEQVLNVVPYLVLSAIMGLGVCFVRLLPFSSNAILLTIQILVGACLYTALNYIFKTPAFIEIVSIMTDKLEPNVSASAVIKERKPLFDE